MMAARWWCGGSREVDRPEGVTTQVEAPNMPPVG
jgi:hypothetical protein